MSAIQPDRPWYCRDQAVDEYRSTLTDDDENLPMLKTLKILRAIVVNCGIFAIGGYAMYLGADPLLLGLGTLITFGLYNGLEISDYLALVQAYKEVQTDAGNGGDE